MRKATDRAGPKKLETTLIAARIRPIWRTSTTKTSATANSARSRSLEITPKSAMKSPKMLTNRATHSVRNARCPGIAFMLGGRGVSGTRDP